MPADASLTCPRCGGDLQIHSAMGHVTLRICVRVGCRWLSMVEVAVAVPAA